MQGDPLLSTVQGIVEDILSKRRDLTQEDVLSLIEQKKTEGRGLLSDEGAARLVAEELLIRTHGRELGRMHVRDLVSGLNDVTISGRILLAWPPQQFERRDGTPGRVMNLVLIDRTGRVRCALWDRHADTASRSGDVQGKIIRIGHAYTRQGLAGEPEINAGERSSIEFDPPDIPHVDFPEFHELFIPISEITPERNYVNTIGVVQADPRFYSFTKEDRTGNVLHTIIADESGSISIAAWNERAEELRDIKKGDILQVINARPRLDTNARPELHVETRSQAAILATPPEYLKMPVPRIHKITELTAQTGSADLLVSILAKSDLREFKRPTGEGVMVSSLLIADDSGIASLSLWDNKSQLVNQLAEGDTIRVSDVSVRERLGELRLGLGRSGELQKAPGEIVTPSFTKLNALESAKGLLMVEGAVGDEPLIRQVVTEKGETIDVASFMLRDDVGSAKVTLWRDQAIKATKLRPGTRLRLIGVRVRSGLNGQPELSSIPLTKIEEADKAANDRPAWEDIRQVISLEAGLTTWVKGMVLEVVGGPEFTASCETCGGPLKVMESNFLCDHCGTSKAGNITLNARIRIDDGTGVTNVTLANQDPRQFAPTDVQELRERMLRQAEVSLELDTGWLSNLIGKEIEAYGTAETGSPEEKLVFKAMRIVILGKL
jgi:ssDNA-binding replication factor A large subunit